MLTAEGCASRRKRLWDALPAKCDFVIVGDPSHQVYFANYFASPFEFRTTESGALLVLEPERATLVADNLMEPFLDRAFADEIVAPIWYEAKRSTEERRSKLVASVLSRLAAIPGIRVGVELGAVPAGVVEGLRAARPGLELVDLGPVIRPLRRSKDPDELDLIRRSVHAGEVAHAAALVQVQPGMSEVEAFTIVQRAAIEALGEPAIVYGDFVSGPRCERERGGRPSSRTIEPGDLLLLDFSVVVTGYRGDFTNTFAVGGAPTPRQLELFDACVGALRAGESLLKPGAPARAVDGAVHDHFRALGLDEHFGSHTGHGLGLGHPEPPYLVPGSDETLQAGDVIALEPGLYIDGVGGMRYERNYLVTETGYETLSHHELRIAR